MPPPPQLCRTRLRAGLGWAGLAGLGWAGLVEADLLSSFWWCDVLLGTTSWRPAAGASTPGLTPGTSQARYREP